MSFLFKASQKVDGNFEEGVCLTMVDTQLWAELGGADLPFHSWQWGGGSRAGLVKAAWSKG